MKDDHITEYIRNNSTGRMLSLDGFYIKNTEKSRYIEQILVTETLAFCALQIMNMLYFIQNVGISKSFYS